MFYNVKFSDGSMSFGKNMIFFRADIYYTLYKYSRECDDGIVRRNEAEQNVNVAYRAG